MIPKILLTGKDGQVGRELNLLLGSLGEVVAFGRGQLDLEKPADLRDAIREVAPSFIVNAAAYTAVDKAEGEQSKALAINGVAPGVMAEEAKRIGAVLIHYSTDYVFDGTKREPYLEEDPTNPLNAYGRTKLEGERAIQRADAAHLILRTEWVYATAGKNFLLTILRLASERDELRIVEDQVGSPTFSVSIALATREIIAKLMSGKSAVQFPSAGGIYHLTAAGETSWYEFAKAILEEASQGPRRAWLSEALRHREITARTVTPIRTAEYPTPARRPAYSVLSNQRLAHVFGLRLADWRQQLHTAFSGDLS
jgi:dTDP-4-dehydrorhamnose reductase